MEPFNNYFTDQAYLGKNKNIDKKLLTLSQLKVIRSLHIQM